MTRNLILIRHAKSSWDDPDLSDKDRPLNGRGRKSAKAIGDWLRAKGHVPDAALSSSSTRTRETWDLLGFDAPVTFTDDLYHVTGNQILRMLSGETEKTVLLLGHNPGISEFADEIVSAPPKHPKFVDYPTGATLVLRFDIDDWSSLGWRSGAVVDFIVPRDLLDQI
ncbi:SixA phosphatase family protein [Phaeobacter marinintestinus]|uniref:SixA phosphatase family protein n=1 Tax=Falsiphaeobacter marinintestinus TaxID=1492905 RepID=UPI0011B5FE2C|nr:histidine phosphatase family protein [Phaeobacter marinintestinus]